MPVTVKIEDRAKKEAQAAAGPPAQLDDYVHLSERSEGSKAFGLWMLFIVVLVAGFAVSPVTRNIGIGIFLWWLFSCIGYFFIGPRLVMRRLRVHGKDIEINTKNQPRLKSVLAKGSAILGLPEPEAFLLPEGISQVRIFGRPTFVVLTQAALDLLQPPEVDVHVLRALVHERQNHTRRLMLMKFLNDTPPTVRPLAWPVAMYAFFLRLWWIELAEMTADRLTLLLVKNPKLLQAALIKQQAATDPLMQEHEITSADVDNFIQQAGLIGLQGSEISTQYKLGQAIHENSYLEERLQEISAWAKSDEFQEALQKLAEARTQKTGASIPAASPNAQPTPAEK